MRTPVAFDFKKEYKEFYLPSTKPDIVMPPLEGFWKQEEIDGMDMHIRRSCILPVGTA